MRRTDKGQTFCRNEYNVTGLCARQACPLANSRYATIRSDSLDASKLYLYTKTIERAHLPSKLWERQRLSSNYAKALEEVDQALPYWPKFLVHKCKQRLTRLTQVSLRMKRVAKEEARLGEKVTPKLAPKVRKREEARERKAERAAKVERAIERELIERLRSGAYGDKPLNVEEGMWRKVLRGLERSGEGTRDKDLDEGVEEGDGEEEVEGEMEEERELENGDANVEYVSDIEGESDDEDVEDWRRDERLPPDEETKQQRGRKDSSLSESDRESSRDLDEDKEQNLEPKSVGLKRKQARTPTPRPKKRKEAKGPRTNIEYEIENEPPARDALYA